MLKPIENKTLYFFARCSRLKGTRLSITVSTYGILIKYFHCLYRNDFKIRVKIFKETTSYVKACAKL